MCIRLRTGESSHIKRLTFTFTPPCNLHIDSLSLITTAAVSAVGACRDPPPAAAVFPATPAVCRPRRLPLFRRQQPAVFPRRPPSFRHCLPRVGPGICRNFRRQQPAVFPRCPPSFRHCLPCVGPGACRFFRRQHPALFCPWRLPLFSPPAACRLSPPAPSRRRLPAVFLPRKISPSAVPAAFPPSAAWRVLPRFRRHLPLFARCFSDVTCRVPPTAPAAFPPSPALCCHVSAIFELQ